MHLAPLKTDEVLAILHIPKTAGTSLVAELASSGIPFVHIINGLYKTELGAFGTARDHLATIRTDVMEGKFRVLFGHMTRRDVLLGLQMPRKIKFATFLRNPVERFISEYYYAISPREPNHVAVRNIYPTLDIYADRAVDSNTLSHYIEGYRGEPVEDIVNGIEENFNFVGFFDTYNEDADQMLNLISPGHFVSKHLNGREFPVERIGTATLERIRRRNSRDIELYDLLRRKYASRSGLIY